MQFFLTNLFINFTISSQDNFLFYIMRYDKMETLKKIKVALNLMCRIVWTLPKVLFLSC